MQWSGNAALYISQFWAQTTGFLYPPCSSALSLYGRRLWDLLGRKFSSAARCQLGRTLGIISDFQSCKLLSTSEPTAAIDTLSALCAQVL